MNEWWLCPSNVFTKPGGQHGPQCVDACSITQSKEKNTLTWRILEERLAQVYHNKKNEHDIDFEPTQKACLT